MTNTNPAMTAMTTQFLASLTVAPWLRGLLIDAQIYGDAGLATIARMAIAGCPVSLDNARRAHERLMGRA
jgi:hypothetical protein